LAHLVLGAVLLVLISLNVENQSQISGQSHQIIRDVAVTDTLVFMWGAEPQMVIPGIKHHHI
jgi:hypothetical protein